MTRFHIMAINEGRDAELERFDEKTNTDRLSDTLTCLRENYETCRCKAMKFIFENQDQGLDLRSKINTIQEDFYISPNEPEFLAYDILIQMNSEAYLEIQQKIETFPLEVLMSNEIKFVMRVISAVRENNYITFFNLINEANYLMACLMFLFIKKVRVKAINALIRVK